MTKFTSLDDVGYRRVIGEIERWLEKLEAQPGEIRAALYLNVYVFILMPRNGIQIYHGLKKVSEFKYTHPLEIHF